ATVPDERGTCTEIQRIEGAAEVDEERIVHGSGEDLDAADARSGQAVDTLLRQRRGGAGYPGGQINGYRRIAWHGARSHIGWNGEQPGTGRAGGGHPDRSQFRPRSGRSV